MNSREQKAMFKEIAVTAFYIGKSLDDPKRAKVMFQGSENVLHNILINPETKPIIEASGHVYKDAKITLWLH